MILRGEKGGQLSVILIVALIIIAGAITYFLVRNYASPDSSSADFNQIFSSYESCIEGRTKQAIAISSAQGGWIEIKDYFPGSDYAPFSSQLNFMGVAVPYWYYISGNGLIKEDVPLKSEVESEFENYIKEGIRNCDFDKYYSQGFDIKYKEPEVNVQISDSKINVGVTNNLVLKRENSTAMKSKFNVEVNSNFGELYSEARNIYDKQREEAFLENYTVDILSLYTPVDGVEISCSPKIWKSREVVDGLQDALVANIESININGAPSDKKMKYFVVKVPGVENNVQFMYSKEWASKFEITGSDGELMIAEPVGNQPGMGIMGFCYAPYHFVYDVSFPVMVQVTDGNEIFQFPVTVIIDKNVPRKANLMNLSESEVEIDICGNKNQDMNINVFNLALDPINANISYKCFNQVCNLGETENGVLQAKSPTCVNGQLTVRSEGYAEKKAIVSSNEQSTIDVILDKEYEETINLSVGGKEVSGTAVISFSNENGVISTALPDANKLKLSEGMYNISVYVYGNSSVVLPKTTKTQCTEVSEGGFFGFFGGTKEQCVDITIPESKIELALIGGGMTETYLLPTELAKGKMNIAVQSLPTPNSIEQLQTNYLLVNSQRVDVQFE
jgi:hypothetical protein